jgi:hypothetical protein
METVSLTTVSRSENRKVAENSQKNREGCLRELLFFRSCPDDEDLWSR